MTMKLERHPLGAANRPLTEAERDDLRTRIAANGVRNAILLYEGKVLDGWNRYELSDELGVKCPMTEFIGTWNEAKERVMDEETRRALTMRERLELAVRLNEVPPPHRPAENKGDAASPLTAAEVAKKVGVSDRTVKRMRAIVAKGTPELQQAVREEKVSITDGAAIANLPPQEQAAAIATPKPAPRRPAPPPVALPVVGPTQEAYDALADANQTLTEEVERLEARCAAHFSEATDEEKVAARILIEELQAKVRVMEVELDSTRAQRDAYLTECGELRRQCTLYRKRLQRLNADAPEQADAH
jgi:ParB-like chromosome segregation protein Spo0J